MTRRSVTISDETWKAVKLHAVHDGRTVSETVESLLQVGIYVKATNELAAQMATVELPAVDPDKRTH